MSMDQNRRSWVDEHWFGRISGLVRCFPNSMTAIFTNWVESWDLFDVVSTYEWVCAETWWSWVDEYKNEWKSPLNHPLASNEENNAWFLDGTSINICSRSSLRVASRSAALRAVLRRKQQPPLQHLQLQQLPEDSRWTRGRMRHHDQVQEEELRVRIRENIGDRISIRTGFRKRMLTKWYISSIPGRNCHISDANEKVRGVTKLFALSNRICLDFFLFLPIGRYYAEWKINWMSTKVIYNE